MAENYNCDGSGPHSAGTVKILPLSDEPHHGNLILCHADWNREMAYRRERNKEMRALRTGGEPFAIIPWSKGKVYSGNQRRKSGRTASRAARRRGVR